MFFYKNYIVYYKVYCYYCGVFFEKYVYIYICIMVSDKIKVTTATLLYVERGSATFQSLSYLDCTILQ